MIYGIIIAKSALKDYGKLTLSVRSSAKQAMRTYLRHAPKRAIKTRIKKLVGLRKPQFRLRVGNLRIFYDVDDKKKRVEVLGFIPKSLTQRWLKKKGVSK